MQLKSRNIIKTTFERVKEDKLTYVSTFKINGKEFQVKADYPFFLIGQEALENLLLEFSDDVLSCKDTDEISEAIDSTVDNLIFESSN